ncbi:MAG: ABC transporter permease subunit [Candidatus Methanoperedens sp.]|nr:ABC transporter permease subunit [Candidatus Methanoperedens sp.]
MIMSILSFLSLVYNETKRTVKSSTPSYFWFTILVLASSYSLFFEKYVDMSFDRSLMTFKTGNNPMADILIFVTSFAITSSSGVLSGKVPEMVFPTSIGVIFFIILPVLLGLTMMCNFIIKKTGSSIAGELEKKTLYFLAVSPLTRPAIFLGKFAAIFLASIPMILILYIITQWVFTTLFPSSPDLSQEVLNISIITAFLFISVGMLVSVLARTQKSASWIGTKLVGSVALLTTVWIMIPFIEFLLNLTNNNSDFLLYVEKITWFSPFTVELMYLYAPSVAASSLNILIISIFVILILGMVTFIRQDLEY